MGMLVDVYRSGSYDCTNGGISGKRSIRGLCLVNVSGPFEPNDEYPAAALVEHAPFGPSKKMARIVPIDSDGNPTKKWTMFGGNYAAASDSRFTDAVDSIVGHHFYGAVPIHDRIEG